MALTDSVKVIRKRELRANEKAKNDVENEKKRLQYKEKKDA